MKKIVILFAIIFFFLFSQTVKSTTWQTISSGFWNNPSIWSTGVVPPSSSSDTFNIKFPVAFENNLFFNSGALLNIDSTGGLCGHHNITARLGAKITKYGIFELDSLIIPGGEVTCNGPGQVILSYSGIISNGGSLSVNGCPFAVGPWFNCIQPAYSFTLGIEETNLTSSFHLFPNPSKGNINMDYTLNTNENGKLKIYNLSGQLLTEYFLIKNTTNFSITDLPLQNGIYFYSIFNNDKVVYSNKLVIIK